MLRYILMLVIGVFFILPTPAHSLDLTDDVPTICPIPENSNDSVCEINLCLRTGFTGNGCGGAFSVFVCRLSPFCGGSPIPLPDECLCTWIPDALITPAKLGLSSNISLKDLENKLKSEISSRLNDLSSNLGSDLGISNISTCTAKKIRLKGKDDSCHIDTSFSTIQIIKDRKSRKRKIYELTVKSIPKSPELPTIETIIHFTKNKPTRCVIKQNNDIISDDYKCMGAPSQFPSQVVDDTVWDDDFEIDMVDTDFDLADYYEDYPERNPNNNDDNFDDDIFDDDHCNTNSNKDVICQ